MNVQKVTVNQLKVFSQVQMAAEALYDIDARKSSLNQPGKIISETPISSDWLTTGNGHASKFTETDATNFVSEWTLIEHISNTKSGFSGTLFQNKDTKEYVLSCRSTEFIDDAARDCEATNNLEIRQTGWAF